ncbi:o-methylsterigmatocystin oxidoreductase [Colletotrichum incanum]|uniref:O-methylsterigmatocystin oxidoreductase n=1 Tax=Colletotrichum incanum TaxID=1573173 RepID=A0A167ELD2_COLIC|nr:o-methylsterigmatocystin oxidoreductase [Colletotrichum incanum]
MNFSHTTTEAFEYGGYNISQGFFILPPVWWFLHDPDVVCPGLLFSESSLYFNMARTLAAFSTSMAVDEDGKEIEVDMKPKPGVFTYPTEFQLKATPRSKKHVKLIQQLERKYFLGPGDAVLLQSLDNFEVRC